MLAYCKFNGIGVIPYSPLFGGKLATIWRRLVVGLSLLAALSLARMVRVGGRRHELAFRYPLIHTFILVYVVDIDLTLAPTYDLCLFWSRS